MSLPPQPQQTFSEASPVPGGQARLRRALPGPAAPPDPESDGPGLTVQCPRAARGVAARRGPRALSGSARRLAVGCRLGG
eukprot:768066-Hanusia_phi.AAC.10